jgi:hypothetical protein
MMLIRFKALMSLSVGEREREERGTERQTQRKTDKQTDREGMGGQVFELKTEYVSSGRLGGGRRRRR